jgi:hypothetical protein
MSAFSISDLVTFFAVIGMALVFIAVWMVSSERSRNILKSESRKIKNQFDLLEREKFMLLEKVSMLENAQLSSGDGSWGGNAAEAERQLEDTRSRIIALEAENNRLKKELTDAKGSLEEVYKALS